MTNRFPHQLRGLPSKVLGAFVLCIVLAFTVSTIARVGWFQSSVAIGAYDMSLTLNDGHITLIVFVPTVKSGGEKSAFFAYATVLPPLPEQSDKVWYSVELKRLDHGKGGPIDVRAEVGIGLLVFALGVVVCSLWLLRKHRRNRSRGRCVRCGYPLLTFAAAGQGRSPSPNLHAVPTRKRSTAGSGWGWRLARTTAIAFVWLLVEVGVFGLGSAQLNVRFAGPPESDSARSLALLISDSEARIIWSEEQGRGHSGYFQIEAFVPNFGQRKLSSEYREAPVFRAPSIAVSLSLSIMMRALLSSPVWRCGLRIARWARSRPMESSGATAARCPECGFRASAEHRQSKH